MKFIACFAICTMFLAGAVKSQQSLKCLSLGNDTIELSIDEPTIIIFVNQNRCSRCFEDLAKLIKNNGKGLKANKIILARVGPSSKTRRSFTAPLKSYFDVCDSCCYFDTNDWSIGIEDSSSVGGLFKKFNVYRTPAVLFLKGTDSIVWLYSDIFNDALGFNTKFINFIDNYY